MVLVSVDTSLSEQVVAEYIPAENAAHEREERCLHGSHLSCAAEKVAVSLQIYTLFCYTACVPSPASSLTVQLRFSSGSLAKNNGSMEAATGL